jgi:ATP-binding cassette subfamily C protein
MEIVKTFFELLTPRERRNLYLLFCAVLVMAGLEVVSVGAVMPFLQVAADPASVHENVYLSWAYETFDFADTNSFLIALGVVALIALVVSNAFIIFTRWVLERYAWGRNHSISRRLLQTYLNRPYEYFLTRNSSELGKNVLQEVKEVTSQMLQPGLKGAAKGIVALAIIGFLIAVDPVVALMLAVVLATAYAIVYYIVRDWLDRIGEERVQTNTERYQYVNEAFGGIKQVKLRGKEESFLHRFDPPSERYARVQAHYRVIKKAPRYILEAVAFGGIILIAVYLIAVQENIQQVIPMLGLYAFAGYRLMPSLQSAFTGLASARFNIAALEEIHDDLQQQTQAPSHVSTNGTEGSQKKSVTLEDRLVMDQVSFTYPGADEPAIKNLSLEIPARTTVGFVGKTGSGKTTAVDLILGLLKPQEGIISVDGTPLSERNLRRWRQNIGYVPQEIYLADDSITRNIAFGESESKINMDRVIESAKRAQIFTFVENELPRAWKTSVGEEGVKLSGGQRQRIGSARALYHNPSVLVFDEATSALDQATESGVMKAIYKLAKNHTIIIVTHRLRTVNQANKVINICEKQNIQKGD